MIENNLADALCGYLEEKLWDINAVEPAEMMEPLPGSLNTRVPLAAPMNAEAEGGEGKEKVPRIKIFNGYLPPRERGKSQYPFASVILLSGEIGTSQMSICRTLISLGIYAEDHEGHKDLMNLIRRTANALLTLPDLTLDQRYVLTSALNWSISQENLEPCWIGSITAEWQFYAPQFPF